MAGLGEAASIIAVVQITAQIAQICGGYLSEVRRAREDIQRLREKTETLNKIVEQLCLKVKDAGPDTVPNLHSVLQRIETCKSELEMLKDKLAPGKPMKLFGRRALKWPFSSNETHRTIQMLEGYISSFSVALQIDQLYFLRTREKYY